MQPRTNEGLSTPVRFVKGVGETRAAQLAKLGIVTVQDLLWTLPNRYEDRTRASRIADLRAGDWTNVAGTVVSAHWATPKFGRGYFEALLSDEGGSVCCRWFGSEYLKDQVKAGDRLSVYGRVRRQRGGLYLQHPDIEHEKASGEDGDEARVSIHAGRIVPVYPLTENLPQRTMRRILWNAVAQYAEAAEEMLPAETLERRNLMPLGEALRSVHFPEKLEEAQRARRRLVLEEFLCVQYILVARKASAERTLKGVPLRGEGRLREPFLAALPFRLTGAQTKALAEILGDMARPRPMHRLLQGDVGSGKTVVAACAMLDAIECGAQCAVMAPTEILAAQHVSTLSAYLGPHGIRIGALTSSLTPEEKVSARAALADGRTHIAVGTHALIQDRVVFRRLGLIVIDEQHKFGVEQRGLLYEKGEHPHVLVMTATPIPRTLAMTLYGDLDLTVIDEMPSGRMEVVTRVIREAQLELAYDFIRKQVAKGRQAYIVYPLVSESDRLELKSAEAMFANLGRGALRGLRLGLLHGQMPGPEKDSVMGRYRRGEIDVLVSTSVVEVGVDVPNATVMLVEHAERFGLAQLHQLRGRIGRGAHKSFCILHGDPAGLDAWKRLRILEKTTDGFRIAEEDLRIRGMGNILGREQSGVPLLRVGDLINDAQALDEARDEAVRLVESDPEFKNPGYAGLRERSKALYRSVGAFMKVG
jgi:ATP-dependent DNA helicase RecG